jgi:hypothetical protein
LLGYAEWPKVADAVIEAVIRPSKLSGLFLQPTLSSP